MRFPLAITAALSLTAVMTVSQPIFAQNGCARCVSPFNRPSLATPSDTDSNVATQFRASRDRFEETPPLPSQYYSNESKEADSSDGPGTFTVRRTRPMLVPTNSAAPSSSEQTPFSRLRSVPKPAAMSPSIADKINLRYSDPRVLRMLQQLTPSGAESLYAEVSDLIDERYLKPAGYSQRVDSALDHLSQALDIPAFIEAAGVRATPSEISTFQKDLQDLRAALGVQNSNDAISVLRNVQRKAAQSIRVNPSAVGLEFLYGATDSLDPYSMLLPPEKNGEQSVGLRDNVVGIGVEVQPHPAGLKIMKLLPGGSAAEADLRRGDVITHVNGNDLKEMDLNRAVDLIVGPVGSQVEIQAARGARSGRVTLTRLKIALHSVSDVRMEDPARGIGYLKLEQFADSTIGEIDAALTKLNRQGMQSLIMDLRGNPGGLLTTAIALSDRFLPTGTIVSTRGRTQEDNSTELAHFEKTWKVPLVVLIDHNSASASEIFAAAIQENGRGLIVGERSYGKGTVQTLFPLQSFPAALRLTTAKFYSPKGREMAGAGVTPDVMIANEAETTETNDAVLSEAIRQVVDPRIKQMANRYRRTGKIQDESQVAA